MNEPELVEPPKSATFTPLSKIAPKRGGEMATPGSLDDLSFRGLFFGTVFASALHVALLALIGVAVGAGHQISDSEWMAALAIFGIVLPGLGTVVRFPLMTRLRRLPFSEALFLALLAEAIAVSAFHVMFAFLAFFAFFACFGALYILQALVLLSQLVVAGLTGVIVNGFLRDPEPDSGNA